jgi:amidase
MQPTSILSADATSLASLLESGHVSSVDLVKTFLLQIVKHNKAGRKLNAVISTCPEPLVLETAARLDGERAQGKVRSQLHGIPIIIKDAFVTGPELKMPTTVGSVVFAGMEPIRTATVVQRLIDAGLIVLGKANMTEFCGLKSENTPIGWSAVGGQTLSPYRRDDLAEKDQPIAGGSSSGPAVSVAAGFSPMALGLETIGSNVFPASANGLYAITLTRGSIPLDGTFRLSERYEAAGGMARSPQDLVPLVEAMTHQTKNLDASAIELPQLCLGFLNCHWGMGGVHADIVTGKWSLPDVVCRLSR